MKAAIDVANLKEADAIRAALDDAQMRAVVVVVGTLLQLDSPRARERVLTFVLDKLEEEKESAEQPDPIHRRVIPRFTKGRSLLSLTSNPELWSAVHPQVSRLIHAVDSFSQTLGITQSQLLVACALMLRAQLRADVAVVPPALSAVVRLFVVETGVVGPFDVLLWDDMMAACRDEPPAPAPDPRPALRLV